MLTGSTEDSDKITYDFYIYTADLAEITRAYLWLPAKTVDISDNGRSNSRELSVVVGDIDNSDPRISRFVMSVDKEAAHPTNTTVSYTHLTLPTKA